MVASRKMKYLSINLIKGLKDLYKENSRTLKDKIGEDIRKWKAVPCFWIGKVSIAKMVTLKELLDTLSAIPIKIAVALQIQRKQC